MKNRIKIVCIVLIIAGILLAAASVLLIQTTIWQAPSIVIHKSTSVFDWSFALGCSLIVIGLGNLIDLYVEIVKHRRHCNEDPNEVYRDLYKIRIRERAGFMTCKVMYLLLCLVTLFLSSMQVSGKILFPVISLVLLQYILELVFILYYSGKK